MKMERYGLVGHDDWIFDGEDEFPVTTQEIGQTDDGEYYRVADVDAWRGRIRAAVSELDEAWDALNPGENMDRIEAARATLGALLAEVD